MVPYVGAAEGEKYRAEKPARSADDEEFHCGQMPQAEDIAEIVFWKAWYEKEEEDQERTLVMKEIIKALHHPLVHKLVHKRPPEYASEAKRDIGSHGQSYGGKNDSQDRAVEKSAQQPRDFTRYWCCNHLSYLQDNKSEKTEGTEGVNKGPHPFFAGKEFLDFYKDVNQPQLIRSPHEKKSEDNKEYKEPESVPGPEFTWLGN